jgi:hypothetical protein
MGHEEMRAADADRQAVADKLKTALDEGRLDINEYDERLQQAYAAKTYGDLKLLLTDLPAASVPAPILDPGQQRAAEHVRRRWLASVWSGYASTVSIVLLVWAVSSIASSEFLYFWPIWVAGPWGLICLWQTIGGLATGEPEKWQAKLDEEERKKQLKKQAKKERKALERGETIPLEDQLLDPAEKPLRQEKKGD